MLNISPVRCIDVPFPGVPWLSGWFCATSSFRFFAVTEGLTTIVSGADTTSDTGSKSFGWYGSFGFSE